MKNRLGSVTKSKKIVFKCKFDENTQNIIDYIIIHELCHLKIEGHSLWNLLHKFVPNYEDEIKWLELNSKNILQS